MLILLRGSLSLLIWSVSWINESRKSHTIEMANLTLGCCSVSTTLAFRNNYIGL